MKRYNNSYRMIHFNEANVGDAITTLDQNTYEELKRNRYHQVTFSGNGVVKTANVYDFYPLYEAIRNVSLKRRLLEIEKGKK